MKSRNSISIIFSTTKESLAAQQAQKNGLEAKSNTLIGFAGAMIALLIGARASLQSMPAVARGFVLVSICLFVVSILLATFVGWVRKYRSDPHPQILADRYLEKSEEEVQLQLISNLVDSWLDNSSQLERNALLLRIALAAQTVAFVLLGIVLVWALV